MQEITAATDVDVKRSDGYEDRWCLVHDGEKVIVLARPGTRTGTPAGNTMLVGTEQELRDVIEQENLDFPAEQHQP